MPVCRLQVRAGVDGFVICCTSLGQDARMWKLLFLPYLITIKKFGYVLDHCSLGYYMRLVNLCMRFRSSLM